MFKFSSEAAARRFRDNAIKAMLIILGDDMRYWVVTMADGERLIRAGYEAI